MTGVAGITLCLKIRCRRREWKLTEEKSGKNGSVEQRRIPEIVQLPRWWGLVALGPQRKDRWPSWNYRCDVCNELKQFMLLVEPIRLQLRYRSEWKWTHAKVFVPHSYRRKVHDIATCPTLENISEIAESHRKFWTDDMWKSPRFFGVGVENYENYYMKAQAPWLQTRHSL